VRGPLDDEIREVAVTLGAQREERNTFSLGDPEKFRRRITTNHMGRVLDAGFA
jgi:hypothetical protein